LTVYNHERMTLWKVRVQRGSSPGAARSGPSLRATRTRHSSRKQA